MLNNSTLRLAGIVVAIVTGVTIGFEYEAAIGFATYYLLVLLVDIRYEVRRLNFDE